jgi:N-methylhydantoinase B
VTAVGLDPVTFEVVRHKLEAINEEQAITLRGGSASPIVTEASDFNNGIYLPGGEIVSMGPQVVFHSGAMPHVIRHVLEDCSDNPGIGPGDMFVVNDPYKGPVHHPDVAVVAPIHYDGELIAWAGAAAHEVDVGGMVVGSISVRAREKQQEGLMLPPVKLVEGGRVRADIWRLILNMTRQPQLVELDLKGFVASNVVARRRLVELVGEYGLETVRLVMAELIRYSERRFRERLSELPDCEVRSQGFIDHDGHENLVYRIDLRLEKRGDALVFDFSGSSPQAPGLINCVESTLVGAVFGGTAPLLAHDIPWNHGILGALEIVAPRGIVCNAAEPAPTGAGTIGAGWVAVSTIVHALSKLLSLSDRYRSHAQAVTNGTFDALIVGDRNQYGEPYGTQVMDAQMGGGGASAFADGIDQSGGFVTPRPNIPNVETNEMHGPMLYLFRGFLPDSGGDGEHRGGRSAGAALTPYDVERLRCVLTTQGVEVPVSPGIFGGLPGACNRHVLVRGARALELLAEGSLPLPRRSTLEALDVEALGGEVVELAAKVDEFALEAGDVLQYTWSGGGGYGDPARRSSEAVVRDVREGVLSAEKAASVYAARSPRATSGEDAVVVAAYGCGMRVLRNGGRLDLGCDCGHVFGDAAENWKDAARADRLEGPSLPRGIRLHETLELVRYACPACGAVHACDVQERGAPPLQDLLLAPSAFAVAG